MKSPETFRTDEPAPNHAVMWCLRWVVLIQCIGLAGRYLIATGETESDIYGWLYFDLGWPEWVSQTVDDTGMVITLSAAIVSAIAGLLCCQIMQSHLPTQTYQSFIRRFEQAALLWIAAWTVALSIAHMMRVSVYGEIALAEHAVRYAAPLALFLLLRQPHSQSPPSTTAVTHASDRHSLTVLIVAATATFLAHGYKAFEHYAPFVDLILLSDLRWIGLGMSQSTAETSLVVIGILDGIVAITLLLFRFRIAAVYMGVWGLVTAVSRMTALGLDAWPETVLRSANGGVPIAILISLLTPPSPPAVIPNEIDCHAALPFGCRIRHHCCVD